MDKPKTKLVVSDLYFSLYQRSLHPELFDIYARRELKTDKYELSIWATGCSHVVTVHSKDSSLSEVISVPGQPLPKRGLVKRFQFQGQNNHKFTLSRSLSYMTNFHVEKMSASLYRQSQTDLEHFSRSRGLFVKFPEVRNNLVPFTYIDFEARRDELHVHTFHAYPDEMTIVKTQSLIGFYA